MSVEKEMIKFLSDHQIHQLSPLNMCKSQKQWYIHDLLDILNNPTKEHKIFGYNCLTLLWLWDNFKVTESAMNR